MKFLQRHMVVISEVLDTCVNKLPKVDAWQCGGWELNPRPVDCKSSNITTTLVSQ